MPGSSITALAKATGTTHAHASRTMKRLKRQGLVALKKSGRVKFVVLTNEGKRTAHALMWLSPWRPGND